MACKYHARLKRNNPNIDCPQHCPMRGVFDDDATFKQLYQLLGAQGLFGNGVFSGFFVNHTVEGRRRVAKALQWESQEWDRNPAGGPLQAIRAMEEQILIKQRQGYVVNIGVGFDPVINVPFGPEFNNGSFRCKFHHQVNRKCLDDCIFKKIFPCNSNQDEFDRIFSKFGGGDIIPKFFNGIHDFPTRRLVAQSLIWEAEMWFADAANGPWGVFVANQRTLASLKLPEQQGDAEESVIENGSLSHLVGVDQELCLRVDVDAGAVAVGGPVPVEDDAGDENDGDGNVSLAHLIPEGGPELHLSIGR